MAGADEGSRIRDVVRGSKIRLDILRKLDQQLGSFKSELNQGTIEIQNCSEQYQSHGRVLPRSAKGVEDCTYVGRLGRNRSPTAGSDRRSNLREANRRWVRSYLPLFKRTSNKEDLFNWFDAVDQFFDETQPPEKTKCELASYVLEGEAERWWQQLQQQRLLDGDSEIKLWPRMKFLLSNDFWPAKCSTKCSSEVYRSSIKDVNYGHKISEGWVQQVEGENEGNMEHTNCLIKVSGEPHNSKQNEASGLAILGVSKATFIVGGTETLKDSASSENTIGEVIGPVAQTAVSKGLVNASAEDGPCVMTLDAPSYMFVTHYAKNGTLKDGKYEVFSKTLLLDLTAENSMKLIKERKEKKNTEDSNKNDEFSEENKERNEGAGMIKYLQPDRSTHVKCSTKVPSESYIEKQDGASNLGGLYTYGKEVSNHTKTTNLMETVAEFCNVMHCQLKANIIVGREVGTKPEAMAAIMVLNNETRADNASFAHEKAHKLGMYVVCFLVDEMLTTSFDPGGVSCKENTLASLIPRANVKVRDLRVFLGRCEGSVNFHVSKEFNYELKLMPHSKDTKPRLMKDIATEISFKHLIYADYVHQQVRQGNVPTDAPSYFADISIEKMIQCCALLAITIITEFCDIVVYAKHGKWTLPLIMVGLICWKGSGVVRRSVKAGNNNNCTY